MAGPRLVAVTGVPGTGKTTISAILASELGGEHIELTHLVKEGGLSQGWDQTRATTIANMKALRHAILNIVENARGPVIVDGHYSPEVSPREATCLVVVLRRAPWVLRNELRLRGYSARKVRENTEAELLGTCLSDAIAVQDPNKVLEIDTTHEEPIDTVRLIRAALDGEIELGYGEIDWMSYPETEELLRNL
jgi:adenylate kinase